MATIAIYNENNPTPEEFKEKIESAYDKWIILNYHHIFPDDTKEMNLLRYHNVTNTYSVTPAMFERQMRLARNSDHWIAPVSTVGRYVKQRINSRLEITDHDDRILLKIVNDLDRNIFNIPLTIEFTTDWKVIKVSNSLNDGIYNPRNNKVYINVLPNEEIIIENITEE